MRAVAPDRGCPIAAPEPVSTDHEMLPAIVPRSNSCPASSTYRSHRPSPPRPTVPVLADRDQRDLATVKAIRLMRRPGCPDAERDRLREQVVSWNLPLAHGLARGYRDRGESLEDLCQVAALALVKAVDNFDPDRGTCFAGYATPTILGEVKRHFRDRVWSVHVPRQLQERCLDVTRTRAELIQRLGRSPSTAEIAAALGVTEAQVSATELSTWAYRADSLNRRVGPDQDACERQDLLGEPDRALEVLCDRVTLEAALDRLPDRARHVVHRYFFDNRTQDQIAAEIGLSQMSVSRLLAHTLAQLRAQLAPEAAGRDEGNRGLRVRTHEARPGCLVVTICGRHTGVRQTTELRDALVQIALTDRPATLVVDLRTLVQPSDRIARGCSTRIARAATWVLACTWSTSPLGCSTC
jgi:RNA polymerase sigma-70 factor (sigma-B/F/G subfamily)